ncbi:TPA: radical SAM protein [bacterium]|nr:radical SAM protein [bacterium]
MNIWKNQQLEHQQPTYLNLKEEEFQERIEKLYLLLKECRLCPRECRVNRQEREVGYCKAPEKLVVSSIGPHLGEEPELVGNHGSGTIFFSHCSLKCCFCQNYEISHLGYGREMTEDELASSMLFLQKIGCHNINLVTPTHYVPQIVHAIFIASKKGLLLPIVYNSSGYERMDILRLLDGIIDIYMPDIKYGGSEASLLYSNAPDYFDIAKEAVSLMHAQVGDLVVCDGIAKRGLIIRHLVLPYDEAKTSKVVNFVASLSKNMYINIMDQYRPLYQASRFPKIARKISYGEYQEAINTAVRAGLSRGFYYKL